jgi:polysaccharide biosynthesis/export protein
MMAKTSSILSLTGSLVLLVSTVAWGQAPSQPAPAKQGAQVPPVQTQAAAAHDGFSERNPRYRLRSGDSFDVTFQFQPEFNQTLVVQPDGFVTLRDVGDLQVQGLTIPQVRAALAKSYDPILQSPRISIVLKDFEKPFFIAGGEVQHPGKFELRSDTTAAEALEIAGGLTDSAKHSQVFLFHRVSDDLYETKKIDIKHILSKGDLSEDAHLQPGDMLFVPKSTIAKIGRFIPRSNIGTYLNPTQF